MKLTFSDGMIFDTGGELRTTKRSDGWYVVGNGMLMPVDSEDEGSRLVQEMKRREEEGCTD